MKHCIVVALEASCTALDRVTRNHFRCVLARWSAALDERWQTGLWN